MDIYILYKSLYGELIENSGNSTQIIGAYKTLDEARKNAEELINIDLEDNYVLDNQVENGSNNNGGYYRLYWDKQENYSCYYEMIIEKKVIE